MAILKRFSNQGNERHQQTYTKTLKTQMEMYIQQGQTKYYYCVFLQ